METAEFDPRTVAVSPDLDRWLSASPPVAVDDEPAPPPEPPPPPSE